MEIKQAIMTKNDCYIGGRTITPKGIMVHSVGCAQPKASVFIESWNKSGVDKCVHAFVDATGVYQTLPWDRRGWHAGTGTSGQSANNTHISFEICEPSGFTYNGGTMVGYDVAKNEPFFKTVYQNAVELCAMLCKEYGLDPAKDIICHCEGYKQGIASNHGDVLHWFPKHSKNMDTFRADVKACMAEPQGEEAEKVYKTIADVPEWGRATIQKLLDKGLMSGTDNKGTLNITESMLRVFVVNDRAGLYDKYPAKL